MIWAHNFDGPYRTGSIVKISPHETLIKLAWFISYLAQRYNHVITLYANDELVTIIDVKSKNRRGTKTKTPEQYSGVFIFLYPVI